MKNMGEEAKSWLLRQKKKIISQAVKIERSSLMVGGFEVAGMTICLLLIAPRNSLDAKTDTN